MLMNLPTTVNTEWKTLALYIKYAELGHVITRHCIDEGESASSLLPRVRIDFLLLNGLYELQVLCSPRTGVPL